MNFQEIVKKLDKEASLEHKISSNIKEINDNFNKIKIMAEDYEYLHEDHIRIV